jgi:hypothetical protein
MLVYYISNMSFAPLDQAFNMTAKTDRILDNVGLQAEKGYIKVDTQDNKNSSDWRVSNYRTTTYTKNPEYYFKKDQLYDLLGIYDGKGPGRNVMVDDKLTRGQTEPRPNDKLTEQVTFIRRVDFLPAKHRQITHNKFLVSTTIPSRPQTSFCPQMDLKGINCRHFNRKTDKYYKDKYQRM